MQQPFAAPGHGLQRFAGIAQLGAPGILRRQLGQHVGHEVARGGGQRRDRRQRIHHFMRHDADHGLPGRQFMRGQFGFDILQRDQRCRVPPSTTPVAAALSCSDLRRAPCARSRSRPALGCPGRWQRHRHSAQTRRARRRRVSNSRRAARLSSCTRPCSSTDISATGIWAIRRLQILRLLLALRPAGCAAGPARASWPRPAPRRRCRATGPQKLVTGIVEGDRVQEARDLASRARGEADQRIICAIAARCTARWSRTSRYGRPSRPAQPGSRPARTACNKMPCMEAAKVHIFPSAGTAKRASAPAPRRRG